jgi:hypothetical protein
MNSKNKLNNCKWHEIFVSYRMHDIENVVFHMLGITMT